MSVYGQVKPSFIENQTFDESIVASRMTEVPSNMKARYEWSGSNCIYAGYAINGTAENKTDNGVDTGWIIQMFTYDGSNNCTQRDIAFGNWSNRASYSYS